MPEWIHQKKALRKKQLFKDKKLTIYTQLYLQTLHFNTVNVI